MANTPIEIFLEQIVLKQVEGSVYLIPAITDIQIQELKDAFRKAIIDAYNQGYRDGESTGASGMHNGLADVETFADSELYFNNTFTNQ